MVPYEPQASKGGESPWKVPQKITAKILVVLERVKTCGKSARSNAVMYLGGKPYQEQDKTVCPVVRSDLNTRVCRIDKWLSLYSRKMSKEQNPAYGHRLLTIFIRASE